MWWREKVTKWRDLVIFGDWIVGILDWGMVVWKRETGEVYTEIEMDNRGEVTGAVHPSTYLNKIVIARMCRILEIWNVKTGGKMIYTAVGIHCGRTIGDHIFGANSGYLYACHWIFDG
ncbi:hypothetical protein L873DRAFT_368260 [Choiromyces venosus 120613-1]|uniref:WD40 repeat-like protein n=1 Tax=Choiromyces venosus 120613-1 TaxID=1336337 RepID=A0A3N4JWU3_9PEZI|nr:hypothetical protein L873DRAFT_368260 [Choiromyces venosus 120613-1]